MDSPVEPENDDIEKIFFNVNLYHLFVFSVKDKMGEAKRLIGKYSSNPLWSPLN